MYSKLSEQVSKLKTVVFFLSIFTSTFYPREGKTKIAISMSLPLIRRDLSRRSVTIEVWLRTRANKRLKIRNSCQGHKRKPLQLVIFNRILRFVFFFSTIHLYTVFESLKIKKHESTANNKITNTERAAKCSFFVGYTAFM